MQDYAESVGLNHKKDLCRHYNGSCTEMFEINIYGYIGGFS